MLIRGLKRQKSNDRSRATTLVALLTRDDNKNRSEDFHFKKYWFSLREDVLQGCTAVLYSACLHQGNSSLFEYHYQQVLFCHK